MPPRTGKDKNPLSVKIGIAMEERRLDYNIPQEDIADMTGMSKNHYGCIARGEVDAPVATLKRIAKALKWTLADLFRKAGL